jgi:hypothetical protein
MTPLSRKESLNPPPEQVEVTPSMVKGWREGEGNVIGRGEVNEMGDHSGPAKDKVIETIEILKKKEKKKLTLRRMILTKRGGVAMPVESGRSLSPTLPHPMSYVGAILSTIGGDCQLLSHVLQSTTANESAAITLHQTARRRKRPCRRPGHCNVPWAPNLADEAIPSHHLPTMGGTSTPTTNHTKSARANDQDPRSPMSSTSPLPVTLPSPSLQPFTIEGVTSTCSGGGFNDSFRDSGVILPPRKCPRQKYRPRRVCWRHSPRAPNSQESHCGRRHRPRALNISPGAA